MPRKLKIYRTQIGFFDTIVAAPSQAAALRAWGVRQNLFAEGRAGVTEDAQAAEAALQHPGQPLRRAIGSAGAYAPSAPGPSAAQAGAQGGKSAKRKPPSRKPLERAEAAAAKVEADWERRLADLQRRREALDAEAREVRAEFDARRRRAAEALAEARRTYRAAGGVA